MVVQWKDTWERLGITFDRFIRTTDVDHVAAVKAVLAKLWERDEIYRADYTGWYSVSAERFWTEKDLVDGKCPDTGQPVQEITESNYFFKMSKYQTQLIDHIDANPGFLQPVSRRNEVLGFLRKPLGDLCISRPKSRMSWGIELPFDSDYVTYVWFDALLNYLTGIGYNPDQEGDQADAWRTWWPAQYHIIGKDILTTHAVYWSTMLFALGIEPMQTLYAHGWWTSSDGAKMSKSLGNTIDIDLLTEVFGVDATRYFFMREIAFGGDGGFSYEAFLARYNADLANDLGNLAHRGLSMTAKWLGGKVPPVGPSEPVDDALLKVARAAVLGYESEIEQLHFSKALDSLWTLVRAGNKYIDDVEPWALHKRGEMDRLATVKRNVLEICHLAALMTVPVMPTKSRELLTKLGRETEGIAEDASQMFARAHAGDLSFDMLTDGAALEVGEPLFPRFREMPEKVAALFAAPAEQAAAIEDKSRSKNSSKKKRKDSAGTDEPADGLVDFATFSKIALRTGKVLSAEAHPNADKLLVLKVDIGEAEPRQIVAGIASKFQPDELVGRRVVVVANLKPAKIRKVESQGMLLAAGDKDVIDLVSVDAEPGEIVR